MQHPQNTTQTWFIALSLSSRAGRRACLAGDIRGIGEELRMEGSKGEASEEEEEEEEEEDEEEDNV